MMAWFEAVALLVGLRRRLQQQIKLEEFYREAQPANPTTLVINGGLYCLAPRTPSHLRSEIRALDRAIHDLRGDKLDRVLTGKKPRVKVKLFEPEIELPESEDAHPFRVTKKRKGTKHA